MWKRKLWPTVATISTLLVATRLLAGTTLSRVLQSVGHPGPTLDDAYIHFQYARAFAEGHPFRYVAGEPISTGATSFLWPALLSIPYALGVRGDSILWPAWILSYAALAGLAYEAYRLTRPLAGKTAAFGAGAMTLTFGGFAWCAASGMEVVPFAWLVAHASRRAADWTETVPERRTKRRLLWLVVLAFAAPLARPEGAVTSLVLGIAIFLFPPSLGGSRTPSRASSIAARSMAVVFLVAAIFPNLLLYAFTKSPTSNTAQVKLLFGNPYYDLRTSALANVKVFTSSILDGEYWSAEFLPKGGAVFALLGLVAVVWRGRITNRPFRAFTIVVLALSMLVPCLYVTFLWNRLRYLWPFATGWFVGLACLAATIAQLVARFGRRAAPITMATTTAFLTGGVAGMFAAKLDGVMDDVAQSASGIARQQATLGKWAHEHLPEGARIGVNDTGAIAYFSGRPTFDVVGLTTASEGRYWVAGVGSRLEHYERLAKTTPQVLPTHFIVYPEWMACDAVLGRSLFEATVTNATILGGHTMRVYEARWDRMGSGETPWTKTGAILDAVDVADLESEHDHRYQLLGARDGEQIAEENDTPEGTRIVDGGRKQRTRERFSVHLPKDRDVVAIARVATTTKTTLRLFREDREIAHAEVEPGPWTEVAFELPKGAADPTSTSDLEVRAESGAFTSFHWWFAASPAGGS